MAVTTPEQRAVCERFGVLPDVPAPGSKVGIAENARYRELWPINGLRHTPEAEANGWYLWAGTELSQEDDFFVPLHVQHIPEWRPELVPYLALPPGWRFLVAPGQVDVWFDASLLLR